MGDLIPSQLFSQCVKDIIVYMLFMIYYIGLIQILDIISHYRKEARLY